MAIQANEAAPTGTYQRRERKQLVIVGPNPPQPVVDPKKVEKKKEEQSYESERVLLQVRNILNKLTAQNMDQLTAVLTRLPVNSEDCLRGIVDIVFEKVRFNLYLYSRNIGFVTVP